MKRLPRLGSVLASTLLGAAACAGPGPDARVQARAGRDSLLNAADATCPAPGRTHAPDTLILRTGSSTGTYHVIGCAIARVVEARHNVRVIPVASAGSRDNIADLATGRADLAIVQGDVAHHAFTAEEDTSGSRIRRWLQGSVLRRALAIMGLRSEPVVAITGLHYEQVLVIARDSALHSVREIPNGSRVVIGTDGSGTIGNAREVLAKIAVDSLRLLKEAPRGALRRLGPDVPADSAVDVVFLTSPWDAVLRDTVRWYRARLLPMSDDLRGHLAQEHRYYRDDPGDTAAGTVGTVKIRALLLARGGLSDALVAEILEAIHEDIGTSRSMIRSAHEAAGRDINDDSTLTRDVGVPIHGAAANIFCQEKRAACAYTGSTRVMAWSAFALVCIGFALFGIAFIRPMRRVFLRVVLRFSEGTALSEAFGPDGFVAHWRWLLIPVFALVVVLSGTLLVSLIEIMYSLEVGAASPFTNRPFPGNLVWMLVFAASGYENLTFPISVAGQITSAATVVVAIGGVLFLVGIVTSDGFARRMKMDLKGDPRHLSSHIIICGWNSRAPAAVRRLCSEQADIPNARVAIVAELDFDPVERYRLPASRTLHVRGSPTKLTNLEKAGLSRADTVVILADESVGLDDRDARTLLIAAQAEKTAHRLVSEGRRTHEIHTIAELSDPDNRDVFRAAFVDQILCEREIQEQLLAQSVLNPGLTHFVEAILTSGGAREIYEVPACGAGTTPYIGLTFDDALALGRTAGFLLLGINRGSGRADGAGNGGGLLTNPTEPGDREYRIRARDSLLYLGTDRKALESVFGEASAWRPALLSGGGDALGGN